MQTQRHNVIASLLAAATFTFANAAAATRIWTGAAGDANWHTAGNWDGAVVPQAGDDVEIGIDAVILLPQATAELASFTMTGGTLTFTNWNTSLSATHVLITGGNITLPPPFVDDAMSNRVWIVCADFSLIAPGTINVEGKGYAGGEPNSDGHGPGKSIGDNHAAGPGHGGRGGDGGRFTLRFGGAIYGTPEGPAWPGSGSAGGAGSQSGGPGGGAVQIDASGHVIVSGTITANGGPNTGQYVSGGSGGGIVINCRTLSGANGVIRAAGRNGGSNSAGSGGGRIAVIYDPEAQAALPIPDVIFSAARGTTTGSSLQMGNWSVENYLRVRLEGSLGSPFGQLGTLYFPDNRFLVSPIVHSGVWITPVAPDLSFDSLTVSNVFFSIPVGGLTLTVTNNMQIVNGGRMELTNVTVNVGGNLTLSNAVLDLRAGNDVAGSDWITTIDVGGDLVAHGSSAANASRLKLYAGETNAVYPDYGALVKVADETRIGPHGWIVPHSHPSNGGSPFFDLQNLTVNADGGFNANMAGYRGGFDSANGWGTGYGYGHSTRATGAGYGGRGGRSDSVASRGITYGSADRPVGPGSGGGGSRITNVGLGGRGGGLVRIQAEEVILNGTLSANGSSGNVGAANYSGGGAGGGILVSCQTFSGDASGLLSANGGHAGHTTVCGGGGGGRIAVAYGEPYGVGLPAHRLLIDTVEEGDPLPDHLSYTGSVSVTKGNGYSHEDEAEHGTIRFIRVLHPSGTVLWTR